MTQSASQTAKGGHSQSGRKHAQSVGTPLYSASEITWLRQQAAECAEKARAVTKAAGIKLHPRIAAFRAAAQE